MRLVVLLLALCLVSGEYQVRSLVPILTPVGLQCDFESVSRREHQQVSGGKNRAWAVGSIVLGDEPRYGEVAPKTAENFRGLCTGEYGPRSNGKPLTYKGTRFTRIIPGFVIQGVEFKVRRSRLGRCWVEHLRQEVRRRDVRRVAEPSRHFGDGKYGKEHEPVSVLHHNSAYEEE